MSQQVVQEQNDKSYSNAGRTLLLDSSMESNKTSVLLKELDGLNKHHYSEKSGKYFLEFKTRENSVSAYEKLSSLDKCRVKYCNYDIFVKYKNLNSNDVDYQALGNKHTEWIEKNTGANVLRYKPYRKGDKYLGCGQITIDTKDSFDLLTSSEGLRSFSFGEVSGTHYKYNKQKRSSNENQKSFAAVLNN